eukprot:2141630-Amphidinium_carterae.1
MVAWVLGSLGRPQAIPQIACLRIGFEQGFLRRLLYLNTGASHDIQNRPSIMTLVVEAFTMGTKRSN